MIDRFGARSTPSSVQTWWTYYTTYIPSGFELPQRLAVEVGMQGPCARLDWPVWFCLVALPSSAQLGDRLTRPSSLGPSRQGFGLVYCAAQHGTGRCLRTA